MNMLGVMCVHILFQWRRTEKVDRGEKWRGAKFEESSNLTSDFRE